MLHLQQHDCQDCELQVLEEPAHSIFLILGNYKNESCNRNHSIVACEAYSCIKTLNNVKIDQQRTFNYQPTW